MIISVILVCSLSAQVSFDDFCFSFFLRIAHDMEVLILGIGLGTC